MSKPSLHLIYSSDFSARAEKERELWLKKQEIQSFKNAYQLNLFEKKIVKKEIVMISFAGMTYHSLHEIFKKHSPKIIIDTRKYPDFFAVFSSLREALQEFNNINIRYLSLSYKAEELLLPKTLLKIKEKLKEQDFPPENFPALILFSDKLSMQRVNDILGSDQEITSKFLIKKEVA